MNILGISGLAGSGKDTVAKFLGPLGASNVALADPLKRIAKDVYDFTDLQLWGPSEERNKPDERYPREHTFGEGKLCACCGWNWDDTFSTGDPRCFLTPRYALQLLGTNWGRHCYENTWVVKCVRTAGQLLDDPHLRYDYKRGVYRINGGRDWEGEYTAEDLRVRLVTVSDVRFRNEIRAIQAHGGKVVRVRRPGAGLGGAAGLHPSEAEMMTISDSEFDFVIENEGTLEELEALAIKIGRGMIG